MLKGMWFYHFRKNIKNNYWIQGDFRLDSK